MMDRSEGSGVRLAALSRLFPELVQGRGLIVLLWRRTTLPPLVLEFISWQLLQGNNLILIEGANSFDPYRLVRVATRRGVTAEGLLRGIFISRVFTCHQLEALINERLEGAVRHYRVHGVIINGFLHTFYAEEVALGEALALLRRSIRGLRLLALTCPVLLVCQEPPPGAARRTVFLSLVKGQAQRVMEITDDHCEGGVEVMGRTLVTYTQLLEREEERWKGFRRALRAEDQEVLDELFRWARYHVAAGSYASQPVPFEAMILSMLLEEHKLVKQLEQRIRELEERLGD